MAALISGQALCPVCGHAMNHHAEKMLQEVEHAAPTEAALAPMIAMYSCPHCGNSESRRFEG
jgi:predicted RNA-binding Zn-ribbon protein involved in translation (DUF1610 family)